MESMFILIPIVVLVALVAIVIFAWAVNNGQYDDLDREAEQVLFDEDKPTSSVGASPRARPGQTQGSAPTNKNHD